MRLLFLGDIIGRAPRDEIAQQLPKLKADWKLDIVVINAENAAHGFGLTAQICDDLFKAGADCITTGNHVWDQREIMSYIEREPRLLRPINFPEGAPGRGFYVATTPRGEKVMIANIMGRLFMDAMDDPFAAADKLLKAHRIGENVNAAMIDFHAEATSEKMAMGHYCDGRASFIVGTHTHVPTADAQILPKGTGYQTDAGMCGSFDSVIGMDAPGAVNRFVRKMPGDRLRPAEGPVTLCGVLLDIHSKTGLCEKIEPIRIGGRLIPAIPATV